MARLIEISIETLVKLQTKLIGIKFPSRVTGGWRWVWFWRWEMLNGWYEYSTVRLCHKLLRPGMYILDVGAHIGYFSRIFSDIVGPQGKIFAFEPCPENYILLKHNISKINNNVIESFDLALSDCKSEADLYLSDGNTMHSLLNGYTSNKHGSVRVQTKTVDDFLSDIGNPKIDFVKIDVEGVETRVLYGMEKTIKNNPNLIILMELNPVALRSGGSSSKDLIFQLQNLGFEPKVLTDNGRLMLPDIMSEQTQNLICFRN